MQLDVAGIAGPVLIVAPHPDDETLGCGGLIAELCQRGVAIHTVFITDGGASHRQSLTWPRGRIAELREQEAIDALTVLGASEQPRSFLRLQDAAMPQAGSDAFETAIATLTTWLRTLRPSHVVLPWRRDPHCDHRDSWSLIVDACTRAKRAPEMLEYTIWLDEFGSPEDYPSPGEVQAVELDISRHLETKRQAIQAHRSQLGIVIEDDPSGFVLTPATQDRLIKPIETYWRTWPVA